LVFATCFSKIRVSLRQQKRKRDTIMASIIKAIPTLYGNEARRFRDMADETERKYDLRPKRDISVDPRYKAMRKILERSNITY
jgi:hypothetical protein